MIWDRKNIIGFELLVKNRLGPYKLIAKQSDGKYWMDYCWSSDKSKVKDYSSIGIISEDMIGYKVYLMTAAGDIELSAKNFK